MTVTHDRFETAGRRRCRWLGALLALALVLVPGAAPATATNLAAPIVGMAATPDGNGH